MAIDQQQVLHVAALARLKLSEDEVSRLATQLGAILEHVDQLSQVDTQGVVATEHLAVEQLPLRKDTPVPGLSTETALASAPRVLQGGFGVPEFVEDD